MAYYVVWVDKKHAKVFALSEHGLAKRNLEAAPLSRQRN